MARLISMYKDMHRVPLKAPAVTTPESAVYAELDLALSGNPNREQLTALLSRHAYASDAAYQQNIDKSLDHSDLLQVVSRNTHMSAIILRDVIIGSTTFKSTGSDAAGYRVISQTVGSAASQYFVVREDGTYRVVASNPDSREVGNFALYALAHNQPVLAKSILDWKRDLLHKGGGDDPFSGPLLPLFWTVGSMRADADSPESIRLAAISLLVGSMDIKPYMAQVVSARQHASGSRQTDLDLLLAEGYVGSEQPEDLRRLPSMRCSIRKPITATALELAGAAYAMNHNATAWKALLTPRLARRPTDPDLLRAQMSMFVAQHEYAAGRKSLKTLFDSAARRSQTTTTSMRGSDSLMMAWDRKLQPRHSRPTQCRGTVTRLPSYAGVYLCRQNKVTEREQCLSQAMIAGTLGHPDSAVWYCPGPAV